MGEGKGFLGRLFSPKETAEPVPALTDDEKDARAMSRREFLKGAVAAVTVATVGLPDQAAAHTHDTDSEKEQREEAEQIMRMAIDTLRLGLDRAHISIPRQRESQTIAEQDKLREMLFAMKGRDGQELPSMVAQAAEFGLRYGVKDLKTLIVLAKDAQMYGWVYQGFLRRGVFMEIGQDPESHFSIRASDFLPLGNQITNEEIDPRLLRKKRTPDAWEVVDIDKTIADRPGWTSPFHKSDFCGYLDDPSVRDLLQKSNCSLAEAYSLIKAAIVHPFVRAGKQSRSEVISWLLRQRDAFMKMKILHATTDHFIYYSYPDAKADFDGDILDTLGKRFVKEPSKIDRVDTQDTRAMFDPESRVADAYTYQEKNDEAQRLQHHVHTSIAQSKGNTTVYFNTHGSDKYTVLVPSWDNSLSVGDVAFSIDDLAGALIERVAQDGPSSLREICLIFDQCHSHDFSLSLVRSIAMKAGKKGMSVTAFPTIITGAQVGSFAYSNVLNGGLRRNKTAIQREGQLTGEFLVRRIQAQGYADADLAFLVGWDAEVVEIGQQVEPSDQQNAHIAA